jgi:hypothetical protein
MTDRHSGYIVTLKEDVREDDATDIMIALLMVRGVLSVTPHIGSVSDIIVRERVRRELLDKLLAIAGERS